MVTTRGRRSTAATAAEEDSPRRSRRAKESTPPAEAEASDPGETIGSRLRKRRFAQIGNASASENKSPSAKRSRRSLTPVETADPPIPAKSTPSTRTRNRRTRASEADKVQETTEQGKAQGPEEIDDTVEQLIQEAEASLVTGQEAEPILPNAPPLDSLPLIERFKLLLPRATTVPFDAEDQASVLQAIVEHCEKVDRYEKWGKNIHTDGLPTMGGEPGLQSRALPILANLTTQLLHIFATYSYLDLVMVVAEPDSETGEVFRAYNQLFERTKKVYATKDAFISVPETNGDAADVVKQARNANLATFVISCFGSGDVGFYHLNEYFMEIFASDGSRLLKQQASIYLELKTQAYLSAMSNKERVKAVVLDELFPPDLEQRLLNRRPGARPLHPSESDFLERARNRRRHLEAEADTTAALDKLKERYKWESFLADLAGYLCKNFEGLVGHPASSMERLCGNVVSLRQAPSREDHTPSLRQTPPVPQQHSPSPRPTSSHYSPQAPPPFPRHVVPPAPPQPPSYYQLPPPQHPMHLRGPPMGPNGYSQPPLHHGEDIAAKAARAAQEAFQGYLPNGQPVMAGRPMPAPHHYPPGPYGLPPPQHVQSPPAHYPPPHTTAYRPVPPSHHQTHQIGPPAGHVQASYPHAPPPQAGPHPYYDPQLQGPAPHPQAQHMQMHHSPHPQSPHYRTASRPHEGQLVHHFPPPPGYPPHPGAYYGQQPPPLYPPAPAAPPAPSMMYSIPHGQSLPTSVLYEKARSVASKGSSSGRSKGSTVSQRRPWTTEEEQALMAGLDFVKGPHWSQILAMYGSGGSHGEALRDRTQVQLKDKARNLKLFFLKSGIEVPYHLGMVTGELKSRAPSHVSLEADGMMVTPPHRDRIEAVMDFDTASTPTKSEPSLNTADAATAEQRSPSQNGTYASPYAAVSTSEPTFPPTTDSFNENDNIDPAIKESSGPTPQIQALATSAAEAAAKSIAALGGAAVDRDPYLTAVAETATSGAAPQMQSSLRQASPTPKAEAEAAQLSHAHPEDPNGVKPEAPPSAAEQDRIPDQVPQVNGFQAVNS